VNGGNDVRCTRSNHVSRSRRERGQRGFSLIEILVAMTVTIIGLAGLMSVYTTTVQGNSRAARTVLASTVAQQTMDELRSLPVQAPVVGYQGDTLESKVGGAFPAFDVELLPRTVASDGTPFKRVVTVEPIVVPGQPLSQLLRIRLVISWADEGANVDTTTDSRLKHDIVLESVRTRQDLL
jgi:prepilin-type N-terminal cleavage/methylation domain-containing protein